MDFICVDCLTNSNEVILSGRGLCCPNCSRVYDFIASRPILVVSSDNSLIKEAKSSLSNSVYVPVKRNGKRSTLETWRKHLFPHLNPRHRQWNFLMNKTDEMVSKVNSELGIKGGLILDVGAGDGRYGKLPFAENVNYMCTDLAFTNSNVCVDSLTFISSADCIPLANSSVDVVFNMAVLEHLRNPEKSIEEIYRVLKPGGSCFLIFPLVRPEHMIPHDYQRFTRFWLPNLVKQSCLDFEIIEIVPSNSSIWTAYWYLQAEILMFPFKRFKNRLVAIVLNRFFYITLFPLEKLFTVLDKYFDRSMPIYYWSEIKKMKSDIERA